LVCWWVPMSDIRQILQILIRLALLPDAIDCQPLKIVEACSLPLNTWLV
jgi:hypothetical protein